MRSRSPRKDSGISTDFQRRVRAAVIETIYGSIAENPRRGKPLRGELEGLHSARRGEFRIIYEIDEAGEVVLVHRAHHRGKIYRKR